MASKFGTSFVESEIILAATVEDEKHIEGLMGSMSDRELAEFKEACFTVTSMCGAELRERKAKADAGRS